MMQPRTGLQAGAALLALAAFAISPPAAGQDDQTQGETRMGAAAEALDLHETGVALPPMDSARGRELFVIKGCVICHSVNGVGGASGPALDAAAMPRPVNAFDFVARMWRGAPAMARLQDDLLGELISLTGQDLADLVAFAHDEAAQELLFEDDIPGQIHDAIQR